MPRTLGYLVTWTTYGTWLQGDERGYVKDGRVYAEDAALRQSNVAAMNQDRLLLTPEQQQVVRDAIRLYARRQGHKLLALAVRRDHFHIVLGYINEPLAGVVARYKTASRQALGGVGVHGRTWTAGYDKRFCFDTESLRRRIRYVNKHDI